MQLNGIPAILCLVAKRPQWVRMLLISLARDSRSFLAPSYVALTNARVDSCHRELIAADLVSKLFEKQSFEGTREWATHTLQLLAEVGFPPSDKSNTKGSEDNDSGYNDSQEKDDIDDENDDEHEYAVDEALEMQNVGDTSDWATRTLQLLAAVGFPPSEKSNKEVSKNNNSGSDNLDDEYDTDDENDDQYEDAVEEAQGA